MASEAPSAKGTITSLQASSFQTLMVAWGAGFGMSSPKRGSPGRSLMTKNQPGIFLGAVRRHEPAFGGPRREVEAEEVDVRLHARLVERRLDDVARRVGLLGGVEVAQLSRPRLVDRAAGTSPTRSQSARCA